MTLFLDSTQPDDAHAASGHHDHSEATIAAFAAALAATQQAG